MPAPEPEGIYFSEDADGRERLFAQIWPQSGLFARQPQTPIGPIAGRGA
jgi:hypothetical protein